MPGGTKPLSEPVAFTWKHFNQFAQDINLWNMFENYIFLNNSNKL